MYFLRCVTWLIKKFRQDLRAKILHIFCLLRQPLVFEEGILRGDQAGDLLPVLLSELAELVPADGFSGEAHRRGVAAGLVVVGESALDVALVVNYLPLVILVGTNDAVGIEEVASAYIIKSIII